MNKTIRQISIVIPTYNEAGGIVAMLQTLQKLRRLGCEIIVADGGSADDTVALARPWVDQLLVCGLGRARQMNAGASYSRGQSLLFVHADTRLPDNIAALLTPIAEEDWGFFAVKLSGKSPLLRWVENLMNWRSRITQIATGDQCLWVKKTVFLQLQGFADIPLMEDIELCKRLKKIVRRHYINSPVLTSSRRWDRQGVVLTVLLMWRLRLAYFFGVPATQLVRRYYPAYQCPPTVTYQYPQCQIVQFAKAPMLARVKTRLRSALGDAGCLQLHKSLVTECAVLLQHARLTPPLFEVAGEDVRFFTTIAPNAEVLWQCGDDLGARMFNSFSRHLARREAVIIVGSDCPFFSDDYLSEALQKLNAGCDCVLGPAHDGGYVLIGLSKLDYRLFAGVAWGTDSVLQQTRERLISLGWQYHELPVLADIDRPEDLRLLVNLPNFACLSSPQ